MKNYSRNILEDGSIKFEIFGKRPPIGIIIFFSIIALGGAIVPIIVIGIIDEMKFSILIFMLIFWGVSFFLLRIILWNLYGRQVFLFQNEKLTHYFDYKLFRDQSVVGLVSEFYISSDSRANQDGRVLLNHKDKTTVSPFVIEGLELTELIAELQHLTQAKN